MHFLHRPLARSEYFSIIQSGLATNQYPFVRQAILSWLAAYPGDLKAGLLYARLLAGERRFAQAVRVLQGLCTVDPEYIEAVDDLQEIIEIAKKSLINPSPSDNISALEVERIVALEASTRAHRFALDGRKPSSGQSVSWGGPIRLARQAIQNKDWSLAESLMDEALSQERTHPLIEITHLQYLAQNPDVPPELRYQIARDYHERWPDTLQFMLYLADWTFDGGQSGPAVALLHMAAARDVEGQVVRRMWGTKHPYRSLWPDRLELKLDLMVPAAVMAMLGWNRLSASQALQPPVLDESPIQSNQFEPIDLVLPPIDILPTTEKNSQPSPISVAAESVDSINTPIEIKPIQTSRSKTRIRSEERDLKSIEQEIEKIARRINKPGITRQDGRFPVYVIFSLRYRLKAVYGNRICDALENEMRQLGQAIQNRPGWGSRVFFADDPACSLPIGINPVKAEDPWGLKLALADLDDWLGERGERIGAVLIVGGPEIVPFHHLPNPLNDPDSDVPSDNPYASRDENYFIPEWPVGRIPGGTETDARLLFTALRRFQLTHTSHNRRLKWTQRLVGWLRNLLKELNPGYHRNFGYTAEIWRKTAGRVFRPIGDPARMNSSPPFGVMNKSIGQQPHNSDTLDGIPVLTGKLGYFNLHGLIDAPEWFGHRDLLRNTSEPDYPVALRPQDIRPGKGPDQVPAVIFSEACYGMYIHGRALDEAIALKFLEAGSLAVIGSTSMAYGSVGAPPMVAADLLGYTFWRFLKQGMPAGEALRQAKITLASEMHARQDYLDGEDQKTLISFVLYGDPLAEPLKRCRAPKSIRYQAKPLAELNTINERAPFPGDAGPVPAEVMDGVRQAVAKYLPGMSDASMAFVCEEEQQDRRGRDGNPASDQNFAREHQVDDRQTMAKRKRWKVDYRKLVTLSKNVKQSDEIHAEIARLTLDDQGQLVKLVVSR